MRGMDARTGKPLEGDAHLEQSVADILMTPIGSRVGLRDYGSLLMELMDQAMNPAGRLRLFAAVAIALARWEPRIRLERMQLETRAPGAFDLILDSRRLDVPTLNSRARLTIPLRARTALA